MTLSRDPKYFEKLYNDNPDPWDFQSSPYERGKYRATLAMLNGRHFPRAFEIGCSIGVLTQHLGAQCGHLLAVDVAAAALTTARNRCAGLPNVTFEKRKIPAQWPQTGPFDLILFSEILYFLNPADITSCARLARQSLAPGGVILLVNYTGRIDEPCGGEEAAGIFLDAVPGLAPAATWRRETYRMDLLQG